MKIKWPLLLFALAVLCLTAPVAQAATTGFNQTTAGPWDYAASSNWVGSNINGVWDSSLTLTQSQVVTFAADSVLTSGLSFNYGGASRTLTLKGASVAQSLTLGGDIGLNTSGTAANVTFGYSRGADQPGLNVNLGGVVRTLTVAAGRTLTILNITSNGGIVKDGAGTLVLGSFGNTSTFAGGLVIKQGTVNSGNDANSLGAASNPFTIGDSTAGQDATLNIVNNNMTIYGPITIAGGAGTRTITGSFAASRSVTMSGAVALNADLTITTTVLGQFIFSGGFSGTGNLILNSNGTGTTGGVTLTTSSVNINGYITNTGTSPTTISAAIGTKVKGVTQNSPSTLILSGTNTYSSPTLISQGTLCLGGGSLANSTVTVAAGSTLDVQASVAIAGLNDNSGAGGVVLNNKAASTNTLSLAGAGSYVFTGNLQDGTAGVTTALALSKTGPGTQTLGGTNNYSGPTAVNGGKLIVDGSLLGSAAVTVATVATLSGSGTLNGPVNVAARGILDPGGSGTIGTLTLANSSASALTLNGSTIGCDLPNSGTGCDLVAVAGTLVVNGANSIVLSAPNGTVPPGTYTLLTYAATTGTGTFALSAAYPNCSLNYGATSLTITVGDGGLGSVTWRGSASGVWDTTTTNWLNGSTPATYTAGNQVIFDDTASLFSVSYDSVAPVALRFNNNTRNYTLNSSASGISGTTGLVKNGVGTVTLNGSNSFTGGTTIEGGQVVMGDAAALGSGLVTVNTANGLAFAVNAATVSGLVGTGGVALTNGSAPVALTVGGDNGNTTYAGNLTGTGSLLKTGTGTLTLTGTSVIGGTTVANGTLTVTGSLTAGSIQVTGGGVLTGTGSINGPVTVSAGGKLTPVGNWVINDTLSLGAGGTTAMKLGTGATMIRGGTTLTYGGTLVVTNVGAALTTGSAFKLFDAAAYAGTFSSVSLPTLGTGLFWYLDELPLNGTIRVMTTGASSVAAVFATNMVLQRGMAAPVWGTANPGLDVAVSFGGQTKTTTTGADRKWMVRLDALDANATGQTLTVTINGVTPKIFTNVVVGDVWLASGQSNMDGGTTPVSYATNSAADIAAANYPLIRSMKIKTAGTIAPAWDAPINRTWTVCSPTTVSTWSATGYFFARALFQTANVPIGILESAVGDTPCEAWVSLTALNAVPELRTLADNQLDKYFLGTRSISQTAGCLFNDGISPLIPFAVRGAIWYQGEFNASQFEGSIGMQYRVLLPTLIQDWRSRWQQAALPFYYVQLPGWSGTAGAYRAIDYQYLREAQRIILQTTSDVGMAVTIDVGSTNIHPPDKQDVGVRLASLALNHDYGFTNVVPSGPLFRSATTEGSTLRVAFDYADGGLMTGTKNVAIPLDPVVEQVGVGPSFFEIAGSDGTYFAVAAKDAIIDGSNNTLVLSSPSVVNPTLVRYAWTNYPLGNYLYNRAGLPASPFITKAAPATIPTPSIQVTGGMVQLGCAIPNNVTGWIEFSDDLAAGSWAPLDVPQTGTGAIQSITTPVTASPHRFYRWHMAP